MFASGLAAGTHESYFPLVEQFMTQSSPPYCGLTTLAMMLNSLNIDPNQRWQGGWRWFNEDMLLGNCCKPRSEVEQDGMTMDEFAGIARCHGAVVECTRASEGGVDAFREQVIEAVSSPSPPLPTSGRAATRPLFTSPALPVQRKGDRSRPSCGGNGKPRQLWGERRRATGAWRRRRDGWRRRSELCPRACASSRWRT